MVNAVSPAPVRNADYTKVLARVLHRPATLCHRFRRSTITDALAHELGHG
jgi:NAD dependent epimerase/dehydratase family enzyme